MRATFSAPVVAAMLLAGAGAAGAQQHHIPAASGVPHGIPRFCAEAPVQSVASGAWSSPTIWSTGRVPEAGQGVLVAAEHTVMYDVVSDAVLPCVDVAGALTFATGQDTRLLVGTLTVLDRGRLEIGSERAPVPAEITAEVVFADRPLDLARDPEQFGNGLIGLGIVRVHGAPKQPAFVRLAAEPLAGATSLQLEAAPEGWNAGDALVLPDTRQLRQAERGAAYTPQWEEAVIGSITGTTVRLLQPLRFDHRGARTPAGVLEWLPHVGNLTRNVVFRSQNPAGTRAHAMFVQRPAVDIRYARFQHMGRTRMGVLDNTEFAADGSVRRVGTNQIGRYSIHFHHAFGSLEPALNGYQFTLIGNAVDEASKWGITIHNSHYGLVRDNVVYNSRGAAFVTEDGSESFNLFERNFALRSEGSGEFAPRSGYGGATADPGGEGAGFWLRGPNNVLRDNVAANVEVFGYAIAAGALGRVRIPEHKGADTSKPEESVEIDTTSAALLEFSGNEAYGAIQTGVAIGWNGTIRNARIWHTTRHAVTAFPADRLVIDGLVARGDVALLQDRFENPTGVWFSNYAAKTVSVRDSIVQGMRVGVSSPFFLSSASEPGRGDGVATIEDSEFWNYVGISVATAYTPASTQAPIKRAIVRNSRFVPLSGVPASIYAPAAISMNYGMSTGDRTRRDPIVVYNFNGQPSQPFRVFYSSDLREPPAPGCTTRDGIAGFVCDGDGAAQTTAR
ncbi:MAG: G8 domain-containing protein [Vicinamibacterales bacterium]